MTRTFDPVDISTAAFWGKTMRERDVEFAALRSRPTVTFHPPVEVGVTDTGPGFWAATKHADIVHVSRHPEEFCSGRGVGFSDIPAEYNEPFGSFLMTDAPRHTQLRRLVSRAFTPKQVAVIEAQILQQARTIVAEAVAKERCELVSELSMRLPLWTISEMLGVPPARQTELREAANLMVGAQDPKFATDHDDPFSAVLTAGITLSLLGSELAAERREEPTDDLLTALVQAEVDGERLNDEEIGAFTVLLGVAGNDTTRNTITHGVIAFAENPDQWALLRSDPARWMPLAVEEVIRWATPVMTFRRTATIDTSIGDQAVAAGDHVVMFYGSGNRDERVFTDPWRFDISRQPNDHIAFGGGGPHYCLGANLARAQLRSVFGELARSVVSFDVGEPDRLAGAFVNGIRSLDCRFVTDALQPS
ncbi:MAG: cytochrome P450 [Acidimicrobiales bacterium]